MLQDKIKKYLGTPGRFRQTVGDLAHDISAICIETYFTENVKLEKENADLEAKLLKRNANILELEEQIKNIKYLTKDNLIDIFIRNLDKVHYKYGSEQFFEDILYLAIPEVTLDRAEVEKIINTITLGYNSGCPSSLIINGKDKAITAICSLAIPNKLDKNRIIKILKEYIVGNEIILNTVANEIIEGEK